MSWQALAMGAPGATTEPLVTDDDVRVMNRIWVSRAAGFARYAGAALIVVGVIGVVAAGWLGVRLQLAAGDAYVGPFGDGDESLTLAERLDLVVTPVAYAVAAALTAGAGTALRLAADYAVARTGGSLTGYEPGDNWPGEDEEDEAD